jgi:hypothetical protein
MWVILNVRDTSRQGKFLKILRIEIENYSHQHDNGNIINRTSMGIHLFNSFQAISVSRGARYGVFTNKKHALNTLKIDRLLRSDVLLS